MEPVNYGNDKTGICEVAASAQSQSTFASRDAQTPSLMTRKFMSGQTLAPLPRDNNYLDFRPFYIFLYGTLMDPSQLRNVLGVKESPILQPATMVGWKVMMWGQYPALIFEPGNVIQGMAYHVMKESHLESLKRYETEAYKIHGCRTKFVDGSIDGGRTFIFDGDRGELKEGVFDLKDWQLCQLDKL